MSTVSASPKCPRCGASLPADAIAGLCPCCLMVGAMQATQGDNAAASISSPTPEEIAAHFPQLQVIEFLGRGGMGVVYKARQKALGRLVALKLLAPERVADPKFAERFAHEAQALAALNHPNIVTIHDFGQAGGFFYLLMEFVDGVNLRQAMRAGRFTPEQALAVVPPVCEALQYAHEHGIVHRDIKPENLLLDREGRVKIADFGIAKILGAESSGGGLAESQPVGTPQYMAPEQKAHRDTDHRADIYSLGVVLYEMLTGERPSAPIVPPSKRVQVDVRIDEIVLRALETAPELRFATAAEFRTQVEVATGAAGASGGNKEPSTHLSVRRSRVTLLAVAAALVLMPLIAFLAMRARQSGRLASETLLALAEQKAASFSPVVERVISLPDDSAETCALDLDSGKFVPAPEDVREAINNYFILKVKLPDAADRLQRWAAATGADLMLVKAKPRITLAFYGGGVAFPNTSFSKTGYMEVARIAVETGRQQHSPVQPSLPFVIVEQPELDRDGASKAIFFQTREGGTGLFQIVGPADEPNRVKIRYKLLVPPGNAGAPDSAVGFTDAAARTFPLSHAFAEDIIAGGLRAIVPNGSGREVRPTGDNQKVIVMAPHDVMKRVQTFITVMDWPDAIRRDLVAGLPSRAEYPQDTVMHTARSFFHACAMEDATESFAFLLSPEVLAKLKGDTKSREFETYQMGGAPDEAWEKSLRADWPGKAEAIRRLIREWNRYPLKRITEDSGVRIGFGEKYSCTVTFEGAPQGSYPITIEPSRTRKGSQGDSYLFSSLPAWWGIDEQKSASAPASR